MKLFTKLAVLLIASTTLLTTAHAKKPNYHHAFYTVTNNSSYDIQLFRKTDNGADVKTSIIKTWKANSPAFTQKFSLCSYGTYTLFAVPVGIKYNGGGNLKGSNALAQSKALSGSSLSKHHSLTCVCTDAGNSVNFAITRSR